VGFFVRNNNRVDGQGGGWAVRRKIAALPFQPLAE
jgi:hypothetical protein